MQCAAIDMPIDKEPNGRKLAVRLNWNLLRVFYTIVEEQSITKAAKRLRISQLLVSSALQKKLEVQQGSGWCFAAAATSS